MSDTRFITNYGVTVGLNGLAVTVIDCGRSSTTVGFSGTTVSVPCMRQVYVTANVTRSSVANRHVLTFSTDGTDRYSASFEFSGFSLALGRATFTRLA